MAGGEGKRMQSTLPKVLHQVLGEPMIVKILKKVMQLNVEVMYVVCGSALSKIQSTVCEYIDKTDNIVFVNQPIARGTGDAIKHCLPHLVNKDVNVLILNGDTPLVDATLDMFIRTPVPALMVTHLDNPHGNGRIIRNDDGSFVGIVEEKDALVDEKKISLVNCGVYYVSSNDLQKYIPMLTCNNTQNEYYLTDVCAYLRDKLNLVCIPKDIQYELTNVNSPTDLDKAERQGIQCNLKRMGMVVRGLAADDFKKGYLDLMCELSDTIPNKSAEFFASIFEKVYKNDNYHVYVIEDVAQQRIVANVTLLVEHKFIHDGMNVGHIEDVVVARTHRSQKLGKALVQYVNTLMRELKCYKFILDCSDSLEGFYTKIGYGKKNIQMAVYQ
jgi:bifunctional UDP-N-acetylglucosamine pyrophosphorylase/glucosamine-1-phosphate N-acetyltransferase